MFDKLKMKLESKAIEKPEEAEKPETAEKPRAKAKRTAKPEQEKTPEENAAPVHVHAQVKTAENAFAGIREYGSAMEIEDHIDKEIAQAKSALGEYLRQLDTVRGVAEKSKKLHDIVAKVTGKTRTKQNSDILDVNGLEVVLDATPLQELEALESVLRSHQERLLALQKAKDALAPLDQFGVAECLKFLVLEREGIPEQILLKIS